MDWKEVTSKYVTWRKQVMYAKASIRTFALLNKNPEGVLSPMIDEMSAQHGEHNEFHEREIPMIQLANHNLLA